MAGKDNLVPIRTKERARELGRRGGLVKSPKKAWANRLTALKRKGLTDENYKLLVDMMTERDSFGLDNLMFLQSIKKDCKKTGEKINVARALNDLMRSVHGANEPATQVNIQVNIDKEKKEAIIKRLIEE